MTRTLVARALVALVVGGLVLVSGGAAASAATTTAARPPAATAVLPTGSPIISSTCQATYLHYGSRGTCVVQLQFALNLYFDADLALDGIYGPATTTAVYRFQARYGLRHDGRCGPQTWRTLVWVDYRASHGLPY